MINKDKRVAYVCRPVRMTELELNIDTADSSLKLLIAYTRRKRVSLFCQYPVDRSTLSLNICKDANMRPPK